jgi:hypothetical protein
MPEIAYRAYEKFINIYGILNIRFAVEVTPFPDLA